MRGEAQKEILILKQKRGTTILNIFFPNCQVNEFFYIFHLASDKR